MVPDRKESSGKDGWMFPEWKGKIEGSYKNRRFIQVVRVLVCDLRYVKGDLKMIK